MDIVQSFYDEMAADYDRLFENWQKTVREQAEILDRLFKKYGYGRDSHVLDCSCGIGTQAIGLAELGYTVSASDISREELKEAGKRAEDNGVQIDLRKADFRNLENVFSEKFDIVISMDNALPHMLTEKDLEKAVESIVSVTKPGGMIAASIRDYDELLETRPPYSAPYIHKTEKGQRVSFQTWTWEGERYRLVQYIINDEDRLDIKKFATEYRAVKRDELTALFMKCGLSSVYWMFPDETGFYQPIVIAVK